MKICCVRSHLRSQCDLERIFQWSCLIARTLSNLPIVAPLHYLNSLTAPHDNKLCFNFINWSLKYVSEGSSLHQLWRTIFKQCWSLNHHSLVCWIFLLPSHCEVSTCLKVASNAQWSEVDNPIVLTFKEKFKVCTDAVTKTLSSRHQVRAVPFCQLLQEKKVPGPLNLYNSNSSMTTLNCCIWSWGRSRHPFIFTWHQNFIEIP